MRNIQSQTINAIEGLVAQKMDWSILDLKRSAISSTSGEYRLFVQLFDANDIVVFNKEISMPQSTLNSFLNSKDVTIIDNYVSGILNITLL
jgi:hypothetical protein